MKAGDLHPQEAFTFEPAGGIVRFGGSRVVLFDATALGLLRKELIEDLGWNGARMVLTQIGVREVSVTWDPMATGPTGTIVGQSPVPGATILPGATVQLRVAGAAPAP